MDVEKRLKRRLLLTRGIVLFSILFVLYFGYRYSSLITGVDSLVFVIILIIGAIWAEVFNFNPNRLKKREPEQWAKKYPGEVEFERMLQAEGPDFLVIPKAYIKSFQLQISAQKIISTQTIASNSELVTLLPKASIKKRIC